jgi:bifunctional DNA-binding transcriptional regulator/antitoxin component of YhaV-PrlF toxin-antitoxin module
MEFLRRVRKNGVKRYITLPKDIVEYFNLAPGDMIKIDIIKIE